MPLLGIPFDRLSSTSLLIFLVVFIIWSVALVAIANGRFCDNTTKICWFLIVLFLNLPGVLLFVLWGRQQVVNIKKSS
jgi:hypothetical protein